MAILTKIKFIFIIKMNAGSIIKMSDFCQVFESMLLQSKSKVTYNEEIAINVNHLIVKIRVENLPFESNKSINVTKITIVPTNSEIEQLVAHIFKMNRLLTKAAKEEASGALALTVIEPPVREGQHRSKIFSPARIETRLNPYCRL